MLNPEQADKLRQTLFTSGWKEVIEPTLLQRAKIALNALLLPPAERKVRGGEFADTEDADLRAIIRECDWNRLVWAQHLSAYDHNRRLDELDRQGNGATDTPSAMNPTPANP